MCKETNLQLIRNHKSHFRFLILWVCLAILLPTQSFAVEKESQVQLDTLVDACVRAAKKDQICEFIVEVKEIGVDTIEVIKRFANLTPTQYAILTAANSIANGRIRIRGRNLWNPEIINTLDIQKDKVMLIFDTTF